MNQPVNQPVNQYLSSNHLNHSRLQLDNQQIKQSIFVSVDDWCGAGLQSGLPGGGGGGRGGGAGVLRPRGDGDLRAGGVGGGAAGGGAEDGES